MSIYIGSCSYFIPMERAESHEREKNNRAQVQYNIIYDVVSEGYKNFRKKRRYGTVYIYYRRKRRRWRRTLSFGVRTHYILSFTIYNTINRVPDVFLGKTSSTPVQRHVVVIAIIYLYTSVIYNIIII